MSGVKKEFAWLLSSLIIGFSFSVFILPEFVLHPGNVALLRGDPVGHYVGWSFYRESAWSWPITFISGLMYPFGTSTVYTDGFPLFSIILKLFSKFLPEPFAFFGLLCVINSALMFYSGSLFLRKLRPDLLFSIIGGFFVLFSSVFIWRFFGHFSLTSQWLIIFELLLIMKPQAYLKSDIAYQCLLIFIAVGTHPYLAAMVVPLATALCWKFYNRKLCNRLYAGLLIIIFFVTAFVSAWFFGWFSTSMGASSESGFDFYSSNLLSFINPMYGSALLRNLPAGAGEYEGFAYLGLGLIIPLIGIFFLSFYRKSHFYSSDYFALILILLGYFIYSLSNVIQIGPHRVTLFNLKHFPELANILGVFRSSGRFIWPVFYFVQFFVLLELYDIFSKFPIRRVVILVTLLILQIFDNSYLIKTIKETWNDSATHSTLSSLKDERWSRLNKIGIKHLFLLHDIQSDSSKRDFAYIALKNYITINDAKIARSGLVAKQYYQEQYDRFLKGELLPDNLYVGLKNEKFYPQKYCTNLEGYVICSLHFYPM